MAYVISKPSWPDGINTVTLYWSEPLGMWVEDQAVATSYVSDDMSKDYERVELSG